MNYPAHFVNMHKTSLKISLDFITLSPKSQHAIKALLYFWKIHKSCLEYAFCTTKMFGAADRQDYFISSTEFMAKMPKI